jgi:hypothetical protein
MSTYVLIALPVCFFIFYFIYIFINCIVFFLFIELMSLSTTVEWFGLSTKPDIEEVSFVNFRLEICSPFRF